MKLDSWDKMKLGLCKLNVPFDDLYSSLGLNIAIIVKRNVNRFVMSTVNTQ